MKLLSDVNRNIKFRCSKLNVSKSPLLLVNFKGNGTISLTYKFKLELISESVYAADELMYKNAGVEWDKNAGLELETGVELGSLLKGKERYFSGIVSSFSILGAKKIVDSVTGLKTTYYRYEILLTPKLELLKYSVKTRFYHDLYTDEIITDILDEWDIKYENNLKGGRYSGSSFGPFGSSSKYFKREQCSQYVESDFNFISRLMEEEGIYYYFKHTKSILSRTYTHNGSSGYNASK
jgi:type VI secretion system secreted protein VgrG